MPKVYTQKAGKDYPSEGIKKGDTYYAWTFFHQPARRSKTYPTRIQLTQNDTLLAVYTIFDGDTPQSAADVDDAISSLEDAANDLRSRFDDLPEGFQQGENGQRMEEWADAIESAVSELETLKSDMETEESDHEEAHQDDQGNEEPLVYSFDVAERFGECEPDLS